MDIQSLLSITAIFAIIMGIFTHFFNKRIDDLRDLFKSELESKIKPIETALNNHITDTHKEIVNLKKAIATLDNNLTSNIGSLFDIVKKTFDHMDDLDKRKENKKPNPYDPNTLKELIKKGKK